MDAVLITSWIVPEKLDFLTVFWLTWMCFITSISSFHRQHRLVVQWCFRVFSASLHLVFSIIVFPRVQEPTTTPWSGWWWVVAKWTCWTSELRSGSCFLALCTQWSRYTSLTSCGTKTLSKSDGFFILQLSYK